MLRGYRMTRNDDKAFQTIIAPGVKPFNFNMYLDSSDFHCPFGRFMRDFCVRRQSSEMLNTLARCGIAKGAS